MLRRRTLTSDQVLHAIAHGEFGPDVLSSQGNVAIIMTQDWCTQWRSMGGWLKNLDDTIDLDIYELCYNRVDCFQDFLSLKENVWKNQTIPYVRYYRDGRLITESNYISRKEFLGILGL